MGTENQINKRIFFVDLLNYFRLLHHAAKQYNLQFRILFLNTFQMAKMTVNIPLKRVSILCLAAIISAVTVLYHM